MKQPVVLRVYKGDKLETVRQFENSQIVIGRGGDVQLELQDEGVALLHAMIEDRGGDYYISDLGSQSGTFKGGNRILEDRLNSGDEVTMGPYRIQFFIGVPKPAAPPKTSEADTIAAGVVSSVSFVMPDPPAVDVRDLGIETNPNLKKPDATAATPTPQKPTAPPQKEERKGAPIAPPKPTAPPNIATATPHIPQAKKKLAAQ